MLESRNYAPSEDLAPFLRNHFVFRAPLPADFELIDPLLSETAMLRVLLQGDWAAEFIPGRWQVAGPSIVFGPNSRCFNVRVRGPFVVAGTAIRACGWTALCEQKASDLADRMLPASVTWGDDASGLFDQFDHARDDDDAIVAALEAFWRRQLVKRGIQGVDREMADFEAIANTDSTVRVADVADRLGMSARALERRSCATFGMMPKAVLRRSRFLDLAAAIRGISDPGEEERAALRFADQSHINREFRYFIKMTPGMFEKTPTPLLNAVLKLRQDRNA
jgi:AraC-like DNA-binding protein